MTATLLNDHRIKRPQARVIAEEEFVRFAEAVASLTPEEWAMPTDCTRWTVRVPYLGRT